MRRDRAVLAACIVLAVPTAVAPGSRAAQAAYMTGMVVIVTALWWGAARQEGAARRGWGWMAVTASCWLAGDTVQRVIEAVHGPLDGPTLADAFWLGSYLSLAAAVGVMLRARGLSRRGLGEIGLDTIALSAVAAIVCWRLMIVPSLHTGHGGLQAVVDLLYPAGDLVIIALVLLLVLAPGRRGAPSLMVVGCLTATFVIDCLYSIQYLLPWLDAERLDAVLLVVNALLPAAVLHPHGGELAEPSAARDGVRRLHSWRVVLLGASLIAISVVPALPAADPVLDGYVTAAVAAVVSVSIVLRFYAVVRERELAQGALEHQANHDQLTGLANRSLLRQRMSDVVAGPTGHAALVYLDLDGFKAVNDRWGHAAGDRVLRMVAERLKAQARAGDTVARVGGDEFVVLAPGATPQEAELLLARLLQAVRQPVELGQGVRADGAPCADACADADGSGTVADVGQLACVGASVGVVTFDALGSAGTGRFDHDELLDAADAAMYTAKSDGGGVRWARIGGVGHVPAQASGADAFTRSGER